MEPTLRFTDRVENYVKARPSYPAEMIPLLERECGLNRDSLAVDVGCGTGLLARLFCEFGCRVVGVEPNERMREAGREFLGGYANFKMSEGRAEALPMGGTSVDFITAGQAFHWFDRDQARHEFLRVLKPNGWTVLAWNERILEGSKFSEEYEWLAQTFGTDYAQVHQRNVVTPGVLERFYGHSSYRKQAFANAQELDREAFEARVLSASYMPGPGQEKHAPMMRELHRIFRENEKGGRVTMQYNTVVFYGQMS